MTPEVAEGSGKRRQIRDAAQRLFLRSGYAGTTTDAIVREAGVSKETLYAHYGGKEDLLRDVITNLVLAGDRPPGSKRPDRRPTGRSGLRGELTAVAVRLVDDLMQPQYLALARIVVCETPRLPELGRLFRRAVAERALEHVASTVSTHHDGSLTTADVDDVSRMLVGGLLTFTLLDGLLVGDGPPKKPSRARIARLVARCMRTLPDSTERSRK